MRKIKKEYCYSVFVILIIISVFQYSIFKICGFTMYPDEFGYWASAAKAVGYDWSEVAAMGSYYSFGYSLLLIPILKLFTGGVRAYRAAITVNMILMCGGFLLLKFITGKLFPEANRIKRIFISGIAVFYPAWIFYMQMTLAEALLFFLYTAIVYLFICFIQRPRIMTAVLLAVCFAYMYSVHMRSVGIVIAGLFTLLFWGLFNTKQKKAMLAVIGALGLAGLTVVIMKRNVYTSVFSGADAEKLAVNDYISQVWKIKEILTPYGFLTFIKEIIAKVFYLGMASYGIVYWALGWCIRETSHLIKNFGDKKESIVDVKTWIAVFLSLSFIGEVLICSIYMHGSAKIDCLVYGRYLEFIVPVFMIIGISVMLQSRKLFLETLTMGMISGLMLFPIYSVIEKEKMEGIRGYFVVGISYLLKEDNFDFYSFFRNAWFLGFFLMLLIAGVIWASIKIRNAEWLLGIIIVIEIVSGLLVSVRYTYKVNEVSFVDLRVAEKILENRSAETKVVYLDEGAPEFIDFQQMQLPDIPIHVIKDEAEVQIEALGDYLIVCRDTKRKEEFERIYDKCITTNTFILYYYSDSQQ